MHKLFNKFKRIDVIYGIYTERNTPSSLFPNVTETKTNYDLKCPAVNATSGKYYEVNSFIDVDLEFNVNKETDNLDFKYNFNTSLHPTFDTVHDLIKSHIITGKKDNQYDIQILLPYLFLTDDKEIEITTLSPNLPSENLSFIGGSFNIYSWARSLNSSYVLIDNNKSAKLKLSIDKPMLKFFFSKPINLEYKMFNDKQLKFIKSNYNIVKYRNNINKIYKTHLKRRPKKLL
jgi:hypothetical protein